MQNHRRSTITSIVSEWPQASGFESVKDSGVREGSHQPLSSISSDVGVSSSLILFPSYKNLKTIHPRAVKLRRMKGKTQSVHHERCKSLTSGEIWGAFVNVPNGSNVFSNLVGIRGLKLRQLRVSLDFEEDFLSGGR